MLRHYFTIACRYFMRYPSYSALNVLGLTIGLTGCMLILIYIQDELSYDRFFNHAPRIYRVVDGNNARTAAALAGPLRSLPEVADMVRLGPPGGVWMMQYEDQVFYEKLVYWTDASLFDVLSFPLIQGNPETALKAPSTVVITEETARKYFGDKNPMGKVIRGDDRMDLRVTGIMENIPPNSHFKGDFFVSMPTMPYYFPYENLAEEWDKNRFYAYILLHPDVLPDQLEQRMPAVIGQYLPQEKKEGGSRFDLRLQPITSIHLSSQLENEPDANSDMASIYILASLAVFLLFIACINYMNLATARSAGRSQEVGLRKVLGAYRRQLIRQFLGESLLITLPAFVVSMMLVPLVLPAFMVLAGKEVTLDFTSYLVIGLALAIIALITGFVSGSYPALFLSGFRPVDVLKGALKAHTSGVTLRKLLVLTQFTVTVALLIGTITVYYQLEYMRHVRLGFDKDQIVVIPAGSINAMGSRLELFEEALSQHPDILSVTSSSNLPGMTGGYLNAYPYSVAGSGTDQTFEIQTLSTDYGFIETMGMTLKAGRSFSKAFGSDEDEAVMLNEAAVKRLGWGTPETAVNQYVSSNRDEDWLVIGVVEDFHMQSLHHPVEPLVMTPDWGNQFISTKIRSGDVTARVTAIEGIWKEIYPEYPFTATFLDTDIEQLYQAEQQLSRLFAVFTAIAVFIACLGSVGLAAFTAERRAKEIAVRKVLGASIPNIMRLLSAEVVKLMLIANLIACPVAYLSMQTWLSNFAYRVDTDLSLFLISGLTALLIALLTVGYQVAKAATVNTIRSLRYE